MSRILVTGGRGFIGRALVPLLLARGHEVTVTSRSDECGEPTWPGVKLIQTASLGADTDWAEALEGINAVVHLAGRVHVMNETAVDPLAAFRAVNAEGTRRLAEAAVAAGVDRFVLLSSIKVNGEAARPDTPFTADQPPAPVDPYGISKLEAEQALFSVARRTKLVPVVLRPPLVYGPGVGGNFLRLLGAADRAWPLPFGAVKYRRSMIYVGNLVDAIAAVLVHKNAANEVFLLRDGEDLSFADLYRRLTRALDRPARLVPVPVPLLRALGSLAGMQPELARLLDSLCIDDRKIRDTLGWGAPFSLDEGIGETARWYRDRERPAFP